MPSQFERRDEDDLEPKDVWFWLWIGVLAAGIGVFILVDDVAGIALAVLGAVGFLGLALRRGVWDLPGGGGTLP